MAGERERLLRVVRVADRIAPAEWDVTVWTAGGSHVAGRVDGADQLRLVSAILTALTEGGAGM